MDPFHWKDLFSFSKRERTGVYTLLLLLFLLLLFRVYMEDLFPAGEPVDDSLYTSQVEQWLKEAQPDDLQSDEERSGIFPRQPDRQQVNAFRFDPNRCSRKELERLGLSSRVVDNLLKYREKGGRFDSPQDLLKIYGMDSFTWLGLKDSVWMAHTSRQQVISSFPGADRVAEAPLSELEIDLNLADTLELMQLPGIGPVYARRICKYRDLLGGYVHAQQLHEVYGMDPALVDSIESHLSIDTLQIRQIVINKATFRDFIRHPYLGEYQTKAILNYRDYRNGKVGDIKELLKNNILDQKTYQKMEPYLVADP